MEIYITTSVHARNRLVHEPHLALAPFFARANSLDYLKLHLRSKNIVFKRQGFLFLKQTECVHSICVLFNSFYLVHAEDYGCF